MSKTFKLFVNKKEEFNVAKATQKNIEVICGVMVKCNFLSAQETIHYAQLAGFSPEKNDKGEETYTFDKDLNKQGYWEAILPVLFVEKPKWNENVDVEVLTKAFDFFFTRFGEFTHTQIRCLSLYQSIQNLPSLMSSVKALTDTKMTSSEDTLSKKD